MDHILNSINYLIRGPFDGIMINHGCDCVPLSVSLDYDCAGVSV